MRRIIPILTFLVSSLFTLTGQDRFIIWHDSEVEVKTAAGESSATSPKIQKIANSHLLNIDDPSKVLLLNPGSKDSKIKILFLNSSEESVWQNLEAGSSLSLSELIQNMEPSVLNEPSASLWDRVTTFYAGTTAGANQGVSTSIQTQKERRAASESSAAKKVDGVKFNQSIWQELDRPDDLDISWTSRYPISSVRLKMIGKAEPIFQVDNLGYYRIHYPGLNRSIREKLARNERYEVQVIVRDGAGQEKMASSRFFIKKSFEFDPIIGNQFSTDKLLLRWSSQTVVTEISIKDNESGESLFYLDDFNEINNVLKMTDPNVVGGTYQLGTNNLSSDVIEQFNEGNYYDLEIAVSDERGAKRIYSKKLYCLSTEETLLKSLNDDQDSYQQLMDFTDQASREIPAPETIVSEEGAPLPSRLNNSEEVELQEKSAEIENSQPVDVSTIEENIPVEETVEETVEENSESQAPIFYYSFDQPLITDQSGNNFNAMGSVLMEDRNGQANQAYRFDGKQDFIALPPNESFVFTERTPFTVSFWYRADNPTASLSQIYQEKSPEGSFFLDIKLENGQLMVWCCSKNVSCETLFGKQMLPEKWHHLAVTLDEFSNLNLFVNGELVRSRVITLNIENELASSLVFGKDQSGLSHLAGGMDEIYLFKRALSAEEIADLAK